MRLTDSRPNSPHISQLICNDTLPLESGAAPVWRSRGQPGRPLLTIYCGREGPKQVSLRSTPRERFQLCRFAQPHLKQTLWHVGRFSCWWVSWPRAFKVWWRSGGRLHFDTVCGASPELLPELSISSPSVHILKCQQLWGGRSGARIAAASGPKALQRFPCYVACKLFGTQRGL